MKQTQTHVWSLAGEEAVLYSLARGKAAAVTRESGEIAAYSLARAVSCTWAVPRRDRGTRMRSPSTDPGRPTSSVSYPGPTASHVRLPTFNFAGWLGHTL